MTHVPTLLAAITLDDYATPVLITALKAAALIPGSQLVALSVFPPIEPGTFAVPVSREMNEESAHLEAYVRDAVTSFTHEYPELRVAPIELRVAVGKPAAEIVWLAGDLDVDQIFLGSHSRRGVARIMLGSVAEKVVRLAGCPVSVVRPKAHDKSEKPEADAEIKRDPRSSPHSPG